MRRLQQVHCSSGTGERTAFLSHMGKLPACCPRQGEDTRRAHLGTKWPRLDVSPLRWLIVQREWPLSG